MINFNDILIRKSDDNPTVWVSQRLVVEMCGVSDEYLRKKCRYEYLSSLPPSWRSVAECGDFFLGATGKSWRWGRKNGQFYYDVDTIPNRAPVFYRDQLPTKQELIAKVDGSRMRGSRERKTELCNTLLQAAGEFASDEDVRWLQQASGMSIDIATCRDYGKALGWCRFIAATVASGGYGRLGIAAKGAFYDACAEVIKSLKIANMRTNTGPSLRKKLSNFPMEVEDQRRWIISEKYGNDNRKIIGKCQIVDVTTGEVLRFDIHQAVMFNAYMNIGDPRKEYQQKLYNETYVPMMEAFEIEPVALRTFNSHLTRFYRRLSTDLHRHGTDYYKKQMLTYIPSESLAYAHSLFCGDGSGLIGYQYAKKAVKNGKTVYEQRIMNVYAVLITDVASGYIAGYDFSPEGTHFESEQMVCNAVRMAVQNGGNQTMFEFVSDNWGAYTKNGQKEFLADVFNVARTIEVGNSQGNPAETQFRLFKNSTLRSLKNFIRSSHNVSSIIGQADVSVMSKDDYPVYRDAIKQVVASVDKWNNTPRGNGKTPAQMFREHKHPKCQPMAPIQRRSIFGHKTRVEVTRMRGFVDVKRGGVEYQFTIPDYHNSGAAKISAATGNGYNAVVYVTYDETGADIYSSDGKYILTCTPTIGASKSHAERNDRQLIAQRELKARKRAQLDGAVAFGDQVQEAMSLLASGYGYAADTHFGGGKESINELFEQELNQRIPTSVTKQQIDYNKALAKQQLKEQRDADRLERLQTKAIEEASLQFKRGRISDISKYTGAACFTKNNQKT